MLNPFQPTVAFHIESSISYLQCKSNDHFYMKWNTGLKWVKKYFVYFFCDIFWKLWASNKNIQKQRTTKEKQNPVNESIKKSTHK